MHISEGILSAPVLAAGFAGTAVLAAVSLRKMDTEEIPKISVITAAFFVASLIRIPIIIIPGVSIHLILNGLAGVVLGMRSFPAIMLAIILQAIIFGHGGVTVIGINSFMLGGGGILGYLVWQQRHRFSAGQKRDVLFGGIAAAIAVISSGIILSLSLVTEGEAFMATAVYALAAHVPIMIIEGIVVGACVGFLSKVKPEILAGQITRRRNAA